MSEEKVLVTYSARDGVAVIEIQPPHEPYFHAMHLHCSIRLLVG